MRTILALIAAAGLCLCIGCGSSSSTTTNTFAGDWTATIPAPAATTGTTNTNTSAPTTPVTQMQLSFTLATPSLTTGTTTTGNQPTTPVAPQGNLAVSSFNAGSANGCFDSAALVTANGTPPDTATKVLTIVITENGNMLTMNGALSSDGNSAVGNYNLSGATASCIRRKSSRFP